ncbi:hypothetical protein J2X71_001855 [Rhizobium sp. 1399]|nr:hypothetical protein [Rhizobium sp. 1399]
MTAVVKAGFRVATLDEHPDWVDPTIPGSFTLMVSIGPLIGEPSQACYPSRGHGPFRGHGLMMMFGSDASMCAARFWSRGRLNEVTTTTVPAGHHRPGSALRSRENVTSDRLLAPLERSAIDPDAVQDDGQFWGRRRTCAFFMPLRLASRSPQAFSAHQRLVRCSSILAASKR